MNEQQTMMKKEPLQIEPHNRYDFYRMEHTDIFELGQKMERSMWHAEEIDCSKDLMDFEKFSELEKNVLELTLGYFLSSDGILFENCEEEEKSIHWPEVKYFYGFKSVNELVHSRSYGIQLDTVITDNNRKKELFDSIYTIDIIKQKANWAIEGLKSDSLAERLIYSICIEGIFFSASFATIYWFKHTYPGKINGITNYNDMIARDENLHVDFSVLLYVKYIQNKLTEERVHRIFEEAVKIECEFAKEGITSSLIGMNNTLMEIHIKNISNSRLIQLGYSKLYKDVDKTPFSFMDMICLEPKKNFFETRITEYKKHTQKKDIDFDKNVEDVEF